MTDYLPLPQDLAYRLINTGPVVLVSTYSSDKQDNIAPIAWGCPVDKDPAKVLIAVGDSHQTYKNITDTGEFIVIIPHASQVNMVRQTGSVSGKDTHKFEEFNITAFRGTNIPALIPNNCIGYIECALEQTFTVSDVGLFIGAFRAAAHKKDAFDQRILTEHTGGKTLHHLGSKVFCSPGDSVNEG